MGSQAPALRAAGSYKAKISKEEHLEQSRPYEKSTPETATPSVSTKVYGSGRVPPCSPYLPRRAVGCTWAENGFFKCFHSTRNDSCLSPRSSYPRSHSVGRAARHLFGPCTPRRTWGTRPGKMASCFLRETGSPKTLKF